MFVPAPLHVQVMGTAAVVVTRCDNGTPHLRVQLASLMATFKTELFAYTISKSCMVRSGKKAIRLRFQPASENVPREKTTSRPRGSGYRGFPPGMVPGMRKCRTTGAIGAVFHPWSSLTFFKTRPRMQSDSHTACLVADCCTIFRRQYSLFVSIDVFSTGMLNRVLGLHTII